MDYYRQKSELSPTWTPAGQFTYGLDLFMGYLTHFLLTVLLFFLSIRVLYSLSSWAITVYLGANEM